MDVLEPVRSLVLFNVELSLKTVNEIPGGRGRYTSVLTVCPSPDDDDDDDDDD